MNQMRQRKYQIRLMTFLKARKKQSHFQQQRDAIPELFHVQSVACDRKSVTMCKCGRASHPPCAANKEFSLNSLLSVCQSSLISGLFICVFLIREAWKAMRNSASRFVKSGWILQVNGTRELDLLAFFKPQAL